MSLFANGVSLLGLALVALALLAILTFLLFTTVSPSRNPYLDIVGFMVLPSVLGAGLGLVPLGAAWRWWRLRRQHSAVIGTLGFPHIDLTDRRTQAAIGLFLGITFFVVVPVLAVSGYAGYHYTESTEFCASVCHGVMVPEATTHARSPHARVTCAECHIGAGASWFVKSKISGTRQVIAVWTGSYSRPIPNAITELRPARETCETCHWPKQFFGSQLRAFVHYAPDETNTRRVVRALIKVGGADPSTGRIEGIHMHMVLYGRIQYVATDPELQDIPWVRYELPDGEVRVYRSDGLPSDAPPPPGTVRWFDCMDCHNRGAHHFRPPQLALDLYLDAGHIDATLPFVKEQGVAALVQSYPDVAAAEAGIAERLTGFYQNTYPEVWAEQRAAVEEAVRDVQTVYRDNFFPHMNVSWLSYPENVGHMYSPGCFRCHDGLHADAAGRVISSDCNVCHTFLDPLAKPAGALIPGDFAHSMPLHLHTSLRCDQCHGGGVLLTCRECHGSGAWLELRGQGKFNPTPEWLATLWKGVGLPEGLAHSEPAPTQSSTRPAQPTTQSEPRP
ncbi:MAG: NapC/NirT family cytochrome c [Planctomycetota bacterium]